MKVEEYARLAMRTSPQGHNRVMNGCLGLIGEAGEIVDVVKKYLFQSGENPPFPTDKLTDEGGDVLWYCVELLTGLGWEPDEIGALWERTHQDYIRDLREDTEQMRLTDLVVCLSDACHRPYHILHGMDEIPPGARADMLAATTAIGIMAAIGEALRVHCGASLKDAMERNIEKLRRRYPDGFDPERSLHRTE